MTARGLTLKRLSALLGLARGALLWERLWPAAWPMVGVAGLFLALGLLDLLPHLPAWLHGLVLAGFLVALGVAAVRGAGGLRLPTTAQARRRLERDNHLTHRPLASLNDRLAAGATDRESVQLWAVHRRRLRAQLAHLRVKAPRAGLSAVDPLALRAALGLILVVASAAGSRDWPARLGRALEPNFGALAASAPARLDVWITPPAYTAWPPLFLDPAKTPNETESPLLTIPAGSTLLAQVQGGRATPSLVVGESRSSFAPMTGESYRIEAELGSGQRLVIEQGGRELAAWRVSILADLAPRIEFPAPPARSERAALRLEYQAEDDYGLTQILALIRRIDRPDTEPIELALPLPGRGLKQAEGVSYHDLTPHPWAGLAVEIQLIAVDAIGQRGQSESIRSVIPERIFNHPVARALVELRKRLTLDPEARFPVVQILAEIYKRPDHYFHDLVVALALRSAERRLIHDPLPGAVAEVQQLLWDTALHLEDGALAIAERELREIQRALMDALARDADQAEIERLMDQLQAALDRFLEALAEQLRERLARGGETPPLPSDTEFLQGEDLQRLIDRARDLARTGSRDAAREMLARLQNLLENLRANPFAQGQDEATRNAFQMMRDMDTLAKRQQELLDRSFRRSQRTRPRPGDRSRSERDSQADAQRQERLRRELGEMMRRLGEALGDIPGQLGRAERSMRDARDALKGNRSGDAVGPQSRAVDQLQQGMRAMAERFMEQMGAAAERGMGQLGARPGEGRDPLGRRLGNSGLESLEGVDIPDEMEQRRAREILDELRRRRGERRRPPIELDYIDRLLQQFQ